MKLSKILSLALCSALFMLAGCQESEFVLTYQEGQTDTYKVIQETIKEVNFEQPSQGKSKLDQNIGHVEMVFDQELVNMNDDGSAILEITVKELVFLSKNSKGVNVDFDSKRDGTGKPLSALVGVKYQIKSAPDGSITVVDAKSALAKCKTMEAKTLFKDDYIVKRHTIAGIPTQTAKIAKGKSWIKYGTTPKGALQSKAFEKVYTVTGIENGVANIEMLASETTNEVEGFDKNSGSLGFMANIFDSTDNFTGNMKYNTTTGQIESFSEKLETTHVAAEEPKGGDPDKGPDVLTMKFINNYSIEKI